MLFCYIPLVSARAFENRPVGTYSLVPALSPRTEVVHALVPELSPNDGSYMTVAMPTPLPSYDAPPVIEFVAGVQFEELTGWLTTHFGRFWAEVAADYPKTDDQPPILDVDAVELTLRLPPSRRVFLISADDNYLVQLQSNRFHCNWRRVREADVYPRFDRLFARFQDMWQKFLDFAKRTGLAAVVPRKYELTYVNHIEVLDKDFASFVEQSIKIFNWSAVKPQFLPAPSSLGLNCRFDFQEKGTLSASLAHARRPEGNESLVLNITASGPASLGYSMVEWFQGAPEWIVRGFTDLTTERAHRRWGRKI